MFYWYEELCDKIIQYELNMPVYLLIKIDLTLGRWYVKSVYLTNGHKDQLSRFDDM